MLGFKQFLKEESTEQHVHVAFLGASPNTHVGHMDIFGQMLKMKGKRFAGLSGASTVFNKTERKQIASRQTGGGISFKVEKTAGQTVGRAFHSLKNPENATLHIHAGLERKEFVETLKHAVENGKIPEMGGGKFKNVEIHYPEGPERPHGLSGTKMRQAAADGDLETYKDHLGPNFSHEEAKQHMEKTKQAIESGSLSVKRKPKPKKKTKSPRGSKSIKAK